MRTLRWARVSLACAAFLVPTIGRSQTVRGVVVDPAGTPLNGVLVVLLDSARSSNVSTFTNEFGAFRLTPAVAGSFRLRTFRIGFRVMTSEAFRVAAGQEVTKQLTLASIRFLLDTVRVAGRNACRTPRDSAYVTYAIWEQVRTVLTAVDATARQTALSTTAVTYERVLDRTARRVREQRATLHSALVTQPWQSRAPDELRRVGFVVDAGADDAIYYAPGIEVLLSDVFAEDHCFRLSAAADPGVLGISFEPTPDRRRVSEIKGTMWLDRKTAELRRMTFGYVNIARPFLDEADGTMDFVRLGDGGWAISRWSIRMPVLVRGLSSGNEARVAEIKVAGGDLALVVRGNDTLFSRPPLVLAGSVVDSTSGAAVPAARMSLLGTGLNTVSDNAGRFAMSGVLPGVYTLEIRTASMDSVTAVNQSALTVTDSAPDLQIRVPSGQQIAVSLCGATRLEAAGILVGTIDLRGDSTEPAGVKVVAEWAQPFMRVSGGVVERGSRSRWIEGQTDSRGRFRLCGAPANIAITVRAQTDSANASASVTIPPGGRLARADLTLVPGVVGGLFAGFVVADSTLSPIVDAEVALPSLGLSVLTNERGAFLLAGIPEGAHRLRVRRLGFAPVDAEIAFAANRTQQRKIVLSRSTTLDTIRVSEKSLIPSFEENRKTGLGYFMTRDSLDRQRGRRMSDVLGQVPGLGMARGRSNNGWILSKRVAPSLPKRVGDRDCGQGKWTPAGRWDPGTPCAMTTSNPGTGVYCPDDAERRTGMECGCYARVYLNNTLMNRGNPTPAFDVNSINVNDIEAIEYYRSSAETPAKYNGLDSGCGVLVVWTRRSS